MQCGHVSTAMAPIHLYTVDCLPEGHIPFSPMMAMSSVYCAGRSPLR